MHKIKKVKQKLVMRMAGQRLEYPPSGPKYNLSKEVKRVSKS